MTCANCGCPRSRHEHYNDCDYCGTCPGCASYSPRRQRWWQFWRPE